MEENNAATQKSLKKPGARRCRTAHKHSVSQHATHLPPIQVTRQDPGL